MVSERPVPRLVYLLSGNQSCLGSINIKSRKLSLVKLAFTLLIASEIANGIKDIHHYQSTFSTLRI